MLFLANENFPQPSVLQLRNTGFDIFSITESFPGISDELVIEKAKQLNRIILTFDKDYGEIIFRKNILEPPDVIFFRFKGDNPLEAGIRLTNILKEDKIKFSNCFSVIEENDIRQRKY